MGGNDDLVFDGNGFIFDALEGAISRTGLFAPLILQFAKLILKNCSPPVC